MAAPDSRKTAMTIATPVHTIVGEDPPRQAKPIGPLPKQITGCVIIVSMFAAALLAFWTYRVQSYWSEPYSVTSGTVQAIEIRATRRNAYFLVTTQVEDRRVKFRMQELPAVGDELTVYKFDEASEPYYSITDGRTRPDRESRKTMELYVFSLTAAFGAALSCGAWISRVRRRASYAR